jgi:hypothetical protein
MSQLSSQGVVSRDHVGLKEGGPGSHAELGYFGDGAEERYKGNQAASRARDCLRGFELTLKIAGVFSCVLVPPRGMTLMLYR